jgi:hypothetical protein
MNEIICENITETFANENISVEFLGPSKLASEHSRGGEPFCGVGLSLGLADGLE